MKNKKLFKLEKWEKNRMLLTNKNASNKNKNFKIKIWKKLKRNCKKKSKLDKTIFF